MTLRLTISYVNGDRSEEDCEPEIIDRLRSLQAKGLTGKRLVNELLTDDWGAPPLFVDIVGTSSTEEKVSIRLEYG